MCPNHTVYLLFYLEGNSASTRQSMIWLAVNEFCPDEKGALTQLAEIQKNPKSPSNPSFF